MSWLGDVFIHGYLKRDQPTWRCPEERRCSFCNPHQSDTPEEQIHPLHFDEPEARS